MPTLNPRSPPPAFDLGPWHVDPALDELHRGGEVSKLEPRAMRLLVTLAQAGGGLVTADALLDAVWPGLVVTPSSLYDAVAQLRKALGPGHVGTVARKGYRLLTPVQHRNVPAIAAAGQPGLGPRSIAVLPFGAAGMPENLEFLRESLAGALIAELSRQPGLTVVSRGTMLTFVDSRAAPQKLAQELGVRFIVDGLLELRGDMLQVSVQVADSSRGTQTWADALELPAKTWPEAAQVVVGRLARALHFELNDLATQGPVAGDVELLARAQSARAWIQLFARPQTSETNVQATALAEQALALAPQLAQARMSLAFCDWRAALYGWGSDPPDLQMARAMSGIERAIELDPRDPDGYYVMALVALQHGLLARAEEALHQCLRLAGSFAPAHGLLGLVRSRRGHPEQTAAHCDRAFALSPREPLRAVWHGAKALAALELGDDRGALEEAQRGLAVNPAYPMLNMAGAAAAQRLGLLTQARQCVAVLRERTAFNSLAEVRHRMARTYEDVARAQFESVFALLQAAGLPEG